MLIFYIILVLLGFGVGGPLGVAAAAVIILIIGIIRSIASAVAKSQQERIHKMNYTTCPKCFGEVQIEATVCKHCRNELEPDEYKIKFRNKNTSDWD